MHLNMRAVRRGDRRCARLSAGRRERSREELRAQGAACWAKAHGHPVAGTCCALAASDMQPVEVGRECAITRCIKRCKALLFIHVQREECHAE